MLESPLRILGRFPRPVRLLIMGTLVNKLGTFIVPYLTLVLLRDFHSAETEAAELLFAYGAGSIVSILAGGVAHRSARPAASPCSSASSAAASSPWPWASRRRHASSCRCSSLFGFIADLYRPAASAIIGDLLPSRPAGQRLRRRCAWR